MSTVIFHYIRGFCAHPEPDTNQNEVQNRLPADYRQITGKLPENYQTWRRLIIGRNHRVELVVGIWIQLIKSRDAVFFSDHALVGVNHPGRGRGS